MNYHGDDFTVEQKENGTVEILMDGKITTVGANTTVRNGTAAFRLQSGVEYIIPEYSPDGEVVKNGQLSDNKDFIELKWDNAFDILTTVGGFLVDMKYGVLGKIQNDDDTTSDIISFGGSLDLGFMTPGGAAAVRQNTAAGARWTTDLAEIEYDDQDDGYTFGQSLANSLGTSVGFLIAIVILAGIREKSENNNIPKPFQGTPMVLIASGLMAIAFTGFTGII